VQDFEEGRALGRGGFGHVVVATNRVDGRQYAIKKVLMPASSQQAFAKVGPLGWHPCWDRPACSRRGGHTHTHTRTQTLREVRLFARLDHPSIVRYYSAWIEMQQGRAPAAATAAAADRVARVRTLSEAADDLEASVTNDSHSHHNMDHDDTDVSADEEEDDAPEGEDDDDDDDEESGRAAAGQGPAALRMVLYIQMEARAAHSALTHASVPCVVWCGVCVCVCVYALLCHILPPVCQCG
jgi:serine/threonine protein kinase